ncbi:MAG TPA: 2-oxo-4-hydroxy-4-carboxy-5-ureidoimidazoline decarboxylase [Candidatus Limnocylindrales bacterium]
MAAELPAIEELNRLPIPDFAAALAPLFEGAPQFLTRLAMARPFAGYAELWPAALRIARAMPEAEQLELIDAHPRLGAPPASVSALSFREQGYDQEAALAQAGRLAAELERLNAAYENRFGFRFCVFVNGRSRGTMLPVMAAALDADRETEIRRALGEVVAIAADRARTLAAQ